MNYFLSFSVANYHPRFGDISLKHPHTDADRIMKAFPDEGIVYVITKDSDATGNQFIATISDIAKEATPGQKVYVYFSGHGTFFDTPSGRKTGRVLYDRIVWDDEIVRVLKLFSPGVNVIFISDCCYAESNTREVRDPNLSLKAIPATDPPPRPALARIDHVKTPVFMLSACSILQTAKELNAPFWGLQEGGIFTSALVKALRQDPDISFRNIRAKVQAYVPEQFHQTVKIEYIKARNLLGEKLI